MGLKIPSDRKQTSISVTEAQADELANRLADKPYGKDKEKTEDSNKISGVNLTKTGISLPLSLLRQVEDLALANKRGGGVDKSVSAIMRKALEEYLNK